MFAPLFPNAINKAMQGAFAAAFLKPNLTCFANLYLFEILEKNSE